MRTNSLLCMLLGGAMATGVAVAQPQKSKAKTATTTFPEQRIPQSESEAHMRFLAADELLGRRTGDAGNRIAARYIAEQFRLLGLKPAPGQADFFQRIPFERVSMANSGLLVAGKDSLRLGKDLVILAGGAFGQTAEVVYAGYGLTDGEDGYKGRDVKGRIVVVQGGSPEAKGAREIFRASNQKRKLAADKGAAALIELYSESIPWGMASQYFNREQISLPATADDSKLVHAWVNNTNNRLGRLKEAGQTVLLQTSGRVNMAAPSMNVAGIIEGTDPKLKNEYVVLSAHFDHVGVGRQGGNAYAPTDSIFNGARDNAFGTVALLTAAKALSELRPKRSVLVLALTGEEVGLLGSRYYAENPLVPLNQTVFDLNSDGAGYNDTSIVSVIGLERTGAKAEIEAGAKAFGLGVFAEPAPEQGLFDRSDNVNFAAKGVPAPTFSPGFKSFDEAIAKYYHQAVDNPESLDFAYLHKFCQAFTHAGRLIADRPTRPMWIAGDKYEAAGKALYK
ncbi:M28 family peptidase [Rudanella paleaurantiibacter]|uniref:M28 family peptidase n=1 Tax=Rudanella paleaurantiibacter TaxID=2614655 RepID=A0A7J5TWM9_9BACT|nr:M28 family peptidase [Rudanella paleaurantiibacter]KAB7729034.1 M28 family peptidase [Rudanella paleaurantiibacter]